jgi:alpha-ketoglutarate-dependent taurine dioxygenase
MIHLRGQTTGGLFRYMQPAIAFECPYQIEPLDGVEGALPLIVQALDDPDPGRLRDWLQQNDDWVQEQITHYGALLFRGFAVENAGDFETVARAVDNDLKNDYMGTSPRDARSDYVFSASELPNHFPIPQHCEMSFIANPPRRLFFCCFEAPALGSGETPLVDFRQVYKDLAPEVLERFERGGIRIIRNYSGPNQKNRDLWQLKRWDEIFGSTDRAVVEASCKVEGFEPIWTEGDGLRLISTQPVVRKHPGTGEPVWFNHLTTFHLSAASGEYRRIHKLRPSLQHWGLWQFARGMVLSKRLFQSAEKQAMHVTYHDGSEIPDEDVEAVREAIWRHMVITPWERGDIIAVDNFSVSHGRLPYAGGRDIAVCWA